MKLDIQLSNGDALRAGLKGFEKQIPFATALALTRSAQAAQKDLIAAMPMHLDNPTPFTLNSTFVKSATKSRLIAEVGLKDWAARGTAAARYLFPQIHGGKRGDKRSERAMRFRGLLQPGQYLVPGDDAKLNKYGNIPAPQVVKALSNVSGQIDEAQNTTSDRAKGKRQRSGKQYFMMPNVGIFYRQGKGLRSFMIVGSQPQYQKRFDFFGVMEKSIASHLPDQIQAAIEQAIATARPD